MDIWRLDRIAQLIEEFRIAEDREARSLAGWIWEEILHFGKSEQKELGPAEVRRLESIIQRIKAGEPVQYIAGHAWFYGFRFYVSPDVLIPRPETEELVEWVYSEWKYTDRPLRILDIGTGSGCIAIALKKLLGSHVAVTGIDISSPALEVAVRNATTLDVHITFLKHDFLQLGFEGLEQFDIIVSNPPYISSVSTDAGIADGLKFEPSLALYPEGEDPDIFYKKIILEGFPILNPGGACYLELNEFRANGIFEMAADRGWETREIRKDLQEKARMLRMGKSFSSVETAKD